MTNKQGKIDRQPMEKKEIRSLTSKKSRRRSLGRPTPKTSTSEASVPCKWHGNGLEMKKKVGGRRGAENEKWLGMTSYYRIRKTDGTRAPATDTTMRSNKIANS